MTKEPPASHPGTTVASIVAQVRATISEHAWTDAAGRWPRLRWVETEEPSDYIDVAVALRDMGHADASDAVLADGVRRLPSKRDLLVEFGHSAVRRQDWQEAAARWQRLRDTFPDFWLGYAAGAAALRQAGEYDNAAALIEAGLARFDAEPELLFERARLAEAQGDWDEAAARWRIIAAALPRHWIGYLAGAYSLQRAGRVQEAAALLETGQASIPDDVRLWIEHARLAASVSDWAVAARRWEAVGRRFPDRIDAYANAADAWINAGDNVAAESFLTEGLVRNPDNAALWIAAARIADRRSESDDAVTLWTGAANRFPNEIATHFGLAGALRSRERLTEAESALAKAVELHPSDRGLMTEWAMVAHRRRDMAEAAKRWEMVIEHRPDGEMAHLMLADALKSLGRRTEADDRLRQAMEHFPDRREPWLAYARMAEGDPDSAELLQRWRAAAARFPDYMPCYLSVAAVLRTAQRMEEAEAVLADAADRFPDAWQPLHELGTGATHRSGWDLAAQCFTAMRTRFPDRPEGFIGAAQMEMNRGRLDEASVIVHDALVRFPDEPGIALLYAHTPIHPYARPRDYGEAIRRVDQAQQRFPDDALVARIAVQFRRESGRSDEAWQLAQTQALRFPDDIELGIERARIAIDRADWDQAIAALSSIARRHPQRADVTIRLTDALIGAERLAEAESILLEAMARQPGEHTAFHQFGTIAARRQDWPEALRRWTDGARRFPHIRDFQVRIFETNLRLAEAEPGRHAVTEPPAGAPSDSSPDRALMMQFESLGGSGHGCEFGLAQRYYGAEPLSLLRWSDLGDTCEGLIYALENRLAGIGDPENTLLELIPSEGRNEYWTKDRRYWMAMRGFIFEDQVPYDKMRVQACRRLQFLREKLIQDLADSDKIFVYRNMWRDLTDDELARLHNAMRAFGPNWLLYIRFADSDHPAGSVQIVRPGLMSGYIEHFGCSPRDEPLGNASPAFLAICRKARQLWDRRLDADG